MGRHITRHEPDGLADVLRREAIGERPRFSEALHGRILRGLPVRPATPAVTRATEPRAGEPAGSPWRPVRLAVAAAASLAVGLAIITAGPQPADGPLKRIALVATDSAGGGEAAAGDAAELGIERVPTFDELEAGVREGVSTLAATLLEVPEWRMLADFDAAGFLGADSAR